MYQTSETCGYAQDCTTRELALVDYHKAKLNKTLDSYVSPYKGIKIDKDGFWYCGYCQRIGREQLVQCPECNLYFKGPKRYFPIEYQCINCG